MTFDIPMIKTTSAITISQSHILHPDCLYVATKEAVAKSNNKIVFVQVLRSFQNHYIVNKDREVFMQISMYVHV